MGTIYRVSFVAVDDTNMRYAYFNEANNALKFMKEVEADENFSSPAFMVCHIEESLEEAVAYHLMKD